MYDLIVIGAGPGGYEAAIYAAKMGKKVLLFEKKLLGGTCLNIGCIPTKTLLRSAKALHDCKNATLFGIEAPQPTINLPAIHKRKKDVIALLQKGIATALKKAKVTTITAKAEIKTANSVIANKIEYQTKNILIATGSKPAVPPIPGLDSAQVLDSTAILNLEEIPQSLIIIGAGVIGIEFANLFAEFGSEVTVVEMAGRIAPMIDADIAKRLQMGLKKSKIKFNLSSKVTRIKKGTLYYLNKKGIEEQVSGSYILNATGRTPILDIGLENIGVSCNKAGINVDKYGKTNITGVWACGDVTGRCLLAHSATREGIVAVNNMFGKEDEMNYTNMPSVIYTHPEVASVGASEEQLKEQEIAYKKIMLPLALAGRFIVEHPKESGTIKVLISTDDNSLLGLHIIGGYCGEFISTATTMMEAEMTVEDIARIIFPHPTVSEIIKEAIMHA